jgi:hypothetical protein
MNYILLVKTKAMIMINHIATEEPTNPLHLIAGAFVQIQRDFMTIFTTKEHFECGQV